MRNGSILYIGCDIKMNKTTVDILAHRRNRNYNKKVLFARVLWALAYPLYRLSPRHLYFWRNTLLRLMGAKIGKAVRIYPSAKIFYPWNFRAGDYCTIGAHVDIYSLGKIILKENVMISQGVYLCAGTHDYTKPHLPLIIHPIVIDENCWICADAYIGPGVKIGYAAVIGARSVVSNNVPDKAILAGNPARIIGSR